MPKLSIRSEPGKTDRVPVGTRITIGRGLENDICLADRLMSRRHAEITQRDDGCFVVDMGSTNGTFLNGARVPKEQPLRDGDIITVGESTLVFHEDQRSVTPAPMPLIPQQPAANDVGTGRRTMAVRDLVRQNRVLRILGTATSSLLVQAPLPELFDRILDLVLDALPTERAALALIENHRAQVRATRARSGGKPISEISASVLDRVVERQEGLLLADISADPPLRARASLAGREVKSVMCAPLWVASKAGEPHRILGVLYLETAPGQAAFTEIDLEILIALANVAAAEIEQARLLDEVLEKRRIEADLQLAADIQSSLLPRQAPALPGYDVAVTTRPCHAAGGDYYDLELDAGRLHLAVGDVCGHGLGAAMLMIALRAAVRAHWHDERLAHALERMNRTFHQNVPDDRYATLFSARLDLDDGRLRYVNAGHVRPLLVRADGSGVEALDGGGTVLGAFPSVRYEEHVTRISPGDVLLVFSDGVSETWPDAVSADGALLDIARRGRDLEAADLQQQVFRALETQGGPRAQDDRTLLVLKRRALVS